MTTFEDVQKRKEEMWAAEDAYKKTYLDYLTDILKDVGMLNKPVLCKKLQLRGMIKIVSNDFYSNERPYKFAFHPFKKDGALSQNARYVGCLSSYYFSDIVEAFKLTRVLQTLKENFSVMEEENP